MNRSSLPQTRVLLVSEGSDYGDPARGKSYCYYNLLLPLRDICDDVLHYDFVQRFHEVGRIRMNQELIEFVREARPDVSIIVPYTDELAFETVDAIRSWTRTVGYFFDDMWRTRFSDRWARHFDFVTSGLPAGVRRFRAVGIRNAVQSTYGFNPNVHRPLDAEPEHDVSFVGMYHPYRAWMVERLRAAGYRVVVHGHRWPGGRLPIEDMVRLFNTTRINLNLSGGVHWNFRFLIAYPIAVAWNVKLPKAHEGVKARHFEVAACRAFQLSYEAEDLGQFFDVGREIATFADTRDLLAKVGYYLAREEERRSIAVAGYERVKRDFTAQKLLRDLVEQVMSQPSVPMS